MLTADNVENGYPYLSAWGDDGVTLRFLVSGPVTDYIAQDLDGETDLEAASAALTYSPADHGGLPKKGVTQVNNIADLETFVAYEVDIEYGTLTQLVPQFPPVPTDTKQYSWSILTQGRQEKIGLDFGSAVYEQPAGDYVFPANGVGLAGVSHTNDLILNPDEYGIAQGASILRANASYRCDWTITRNTSAPLRAKWASLVGSVNDDEFIIDNQVYEPGEVFFAGLNGSVIYGNTDERHSFQYLLAENIPKESPVTIYGVPGCYKKGWEIFIPLYIAFLATPKSIPHLYLP